MELRYKQPPLLRVRSSSGFIVLTVAVAWFADYFLYGVLVPVLPFALVSQCGIAESSVQQWNAVLLPLYGGTIALSSPVLGYFADNSSSRRVPLLLGLILLLAGAVLQCLGNSLAVMAIGRVLHGLSGAVIYTVGPALVVDTVGQGRVAQAMSWVGWAMTAGMIVGPLVGGAVLDRAGYRAVFAMVFALVGIDIFMRLAMIEKKTAAHWAREFEEGGAGYEQGACKIENDTQNFEFTSGPLTRAHDGKGSIRDVETPTSAISLPVADDSPRSPCSTDYQVPRPTFFRLITNLRLLVVLWGIFAQALLMCAFDGILAFFVQATFSWSATAAGLAFLPLLITAFVGPLIGVWSDRCGARWPATTGFLLAVPACTCLRLVTTDTLEHKVLLCVLLTLVGLAVTSTLVSLTGEVAFEVEASEGEGAYAQGYGLFNLAYGGGVVGGPLLAGFVWDRAGWGPLTLVLGVLSAVSAAFMAVGTGRRDRSGAGEAVWTMGETC